MILETTNQEEISKALEKNMTNKFIYLAVKNLEMVFIDRESMRIVNSCHPADMFNIICNTRTEDPKILADAIKYFSEKELPFAWWIGFYGEPVNLKSKLENLGLHFDECELGMFIHLDKLPSKEKNLELEIVKVHDQKTLQDFSSVVADIVPNDAGAIKSFFSANQYEILDECSRLILFVGYLKNKPIATSALFCDSGVVGVWDVITLPKARGKGVGTQMTLKALQEGKKFGYRIGVLTASDEGQFVYKKLGFNPLKEYRVCNYNKFRS